MNTKILNALDEIHQNGMTIKWLRPGEMCDNSFDINIPFNCTEEELFSNLNNALETKKMPLYRNYWQKLLKNDK